jgi:hypothetical protein
MDRRSGARWRETLRLPAQNGCWTTWTGWTTDETADYRWASQHKIPDLAEEAYAIRVTDALSQRTTPAVRQHDGHHLL